MKIKVYTIRDAKGEVFNIPFFQKTHGEAERSFTELTNDKQSMVSKYPEDYDLYFLGEYDDIKGTFDTLDTPQHICKAISVVKRQQMPTHLETPNRLFGEPVQQ